MMLQKLSQLQKELNALLEQPLDAAGQARLQEVLRQYNQLLAMLNGNASVDLPTLDRIGSLVGPDRTPLVEGMAVPKLLSTLTELSRLSSTQIAVDPTVKDEPLSIGVGSVQGMPVNLALQQILAGATTREYTFRVKADGTYLVYHPIDNQFAGTDIITILDALSSEAEVPIIPDPNVSGKTSVIFKSMPLEEALAMTLTATPYEFKRITSEYGDYYVVGDRSPQGPAFHQITETRYLQLNHRVPQTVKDLLPLQFQQYVQAEASSTTDPNDQGHFLVITAPTAIVNRIIEIVRNLDLSRRQVLLDARVVAMERGNLLNLGVEWDMPSVQAGGFYDGDNWLKALQVGYSSDSTFTSSLMATLNLLESTSQADIVSNPQVVAQDGRQAQLRSIQEEWFMMSDNQSDVLGYSRAELQKIESGTTLTITPRIGDSNSIELEMSVEVSDSVAKGRESDLPIVTRRQARNSVTVQNGGTVAVAGLTENRTRELDRRVPVLGSLPVVGRLFRNNNNDKSTREVAVFVTATLVREPSVVKSNNEAAGISVGSGVNNQAQPAGAEFTDSLRDALNRQPQ
jgi:hypothetical protein